MPLKITFTISLHQCIAACSLKIFSSCLESPSCRLAPNIDPDLKFGLLCVHVVMELDGKMSAVVLIGLDKNDEWKAKRMVTMSRDGRELIPRHSRCFVINRCVSAKLMKEENHWIDVMLDTDDETIWITGITKIGYTFDERKIEMKNKYWGSSTEIPYKYISQICPK